MQPNTLPVNPYAKLLDPKYSDPSYKPKLVDTRPPMSEFGKGVRAFGDESQAIGGGLVALGAEHLKSITPESFGEKYLEPTREWGQEVYARNMAESTAGAQAPKISQVEGIKGVGDFTDWASYQLGKGLPNLAGLGLGSVAGRGAAKALIKRETKDIAEGAVGAKVGESIAKKKITKDMQNQAQAEVTKKLNRGSVIGGYATAVGYEGGAAFGEALEEGVDPKRAKWAATGIGGLSGALEFMPLYAAAKKIGMGDYAKNGIRNLIKNDKAYGKAAIELARRATLAGGVGAGVESVTEGMQQLVNMVGMRWAREDPMFAKLSEDDWSGLWNSMATGGAVGGAAGGALGVLKGPQEEGGIKDIKEVDLTQIPSEDEQVVEPKVDELDLSQVDLGDVPVVEEAQVPVNKEVIKEPQVAEPVPVEPQIVEPEVKPEPIMEPQTLGQNSKGETVDITPEQTIEMKVKEKSEVEGNGSFAGIEIPKPTDVFKSQAAALAAVQRADLRFAKVSEVEDGWVIESHKPMEEGTVKPEVELSEDHNIIPGDKLEAASTIEGQAFQPKTSTQMREELNQTLGESKTREMEESELMTLSDEVKPITKAEAIEQDLSTNPQFYQDDKNIWRDKDTQEVVPSERQPQGEFDEASGSYIIYGPNQVEGATTAGVALHEGSHSGLDRLLGGKIKEHNKDILKMAKGGNKTAQAAIIRGIEAAKVAEANGADSKRIEFVKQQETAAYYIQHSQELGESSGVSRRMMDKLKAKFRQSTLGKIANSVGIGVELSPQMAVEYAHSAVQNSLNMSKEITRLGKLGSVKIPAVVEQNISVKNNIDKEEVTKLNDVLESDMLLDLSPQLENQKVKIIPLDEGNVRSLDGTIYLSDKFDNTNMKLLKPTLMREVDRVVEDDGGWRGFAQIPMVGSYPNLDKIKSLAQDLSSVNTQGMEVLREVEQLLVNKDSARVAEEALINGELNDSLSPQLMEMGKAIGMVEEGTLESSLYSDIYYSGLTDNIENTGQFKAPADQWLGMINKMGKKEEIEWSGVEDWLKEQEGKVTKKKLLEYLKSQEVSLVDVTKGIGGRDPTLEMTTKDRDVLWDELKKVDNLGFDTIPEAIQAIQDNEDWAKRWDVLDESALIEIGDKHRAYVIDGRKNKPKWSQYQMEGAKENYQELLITKPEQELTEWQIKEFILDRADKGFIDLDQVNTVLADPYAYYSKRDIQADTFTEPAHFDEENIIAFTRFNERVINGKDTLFLEEIQSDWHQQGREKGYGIPINFNVDKELKLIAEKEALVVDGDNDKTFNEYLAVLDPMVEQLNQKLKDAGNVNLEFISTSDGWDLVRQEKDGGAITVNTGNTPQEAYDSFIKGGYIKDEDLPVPNVPLKSTSAWVGLAFKRMLKLAIDQDKDQIAWTEGQVHADRWAGDKKREQGLIKFYDDIMPKVVGKLVKKFGGKVEAKKTNGIVQDVWAVEITPKMRATKDKSLTMFSDISDSPVMAFADVVGASTELLTESQTLESTIGSFDDLRKAAFTNTDNPTEEYNLGAFQRMFVKFVDAFSTIEYKDESIKDKYDLAESIKGMLQGTINRRFFMPLKEMVDKSDILVTEINEWLAAKHILLDGANLDMSKRASEDFVKRLIKHIPKDKKKELQEAKDELLRRYESKGISASELRDEMYGLVESYKEFEVPWRDMNIDDLESTRISNEWQSFKQHASGMFVKGEGLVNTENAPDAEAIFNRFKDNESVKAIGELFNKLTTHQLDLALEGGNITQREYDSMKGDKPNYAPLRRDAFDYETAFSFLQGKGFGSGKGFSARYGSVNSSKPVHIIQNALARAHGAAAAAQKNLANNYLYDKIIADRKTWREWFILGKGGAVSRSQNGFAKKTKHGNEKPTSINLIRKGKRVTITPVEHNERATLFAAAINKLGAQEHGAIAKMFGWVNGIVRFTAVSASPIFLMKNLIRDPLTAAYNMQATEAGDYTTEIFANYGSTLKALKDVYWDGNRGKVGFENSTMLVEEFENAGGRISFTQSLKEMDTGPGSFDRALLFEKNPLSKGLLKMGDKIEEANIIVENIMRLSTFSIMKDKVGKDKAARIAKDLTTNFTRKGFYSGNMGLFYLFFNATVQGNVQVVRNVMGSKKLQGMVGGTIATAMLFDMLGRAMGDDWDEIPEWDKKANIIFPFKINGEWFKIPAPWVYNVVWRLGGMMGENMAGKRDVVDTVVDAMSMTMTTFNPMGGGSFTQALSPTALDPYFQVTENKGWNGHALRPINFPGASSKPQSELYWGSTPEAYKDLAKFLNVSTGGDVAHSGWIDVSPSTIQNTVNFFGAGLWSFGSQVTDTGNKLFNDKDLEVKNIPILSQFATRASSQKETSKYYDRVNEVKSAEKSIREYQKAKDWDKVRESKERYKGALKMSSQVKDTERQLKSLRTRLRAAKSREDKDVIKRMEDRIDSVRSRFNQVWTRRVEG